MKGAIWAGLGRQPASSDRFAGVLGATRWRSQLGHELRRPEADFLRDGIYELRVRHQRVNYRMLYFFHGQAAVVVSHGLTKEKAVPPREIDMAVDRKKRFAANPDRYSTE